MHSLSPFLALSLSLSLSLSLPLTHTHTHTHTHIPPLTWISYFLFLLPTCFRCPASRNSSQHRCFCFPFSHSVSSLWDLGSILTIPLKLFCRDPQGCHACKSQVLSLARSYYFSVELFLLITLSIKCIPFLGFNVALMVFILSVCPILLSLFLTVP